MPASPVRHLAPVLAATAALALLVPGAASAATSTPAPAHAVTAEDRSGSGDDGALLLRSGLVGSTPTADGGPVLFGVQPGTAPWVVESGRVRVDRGGGLELRVRGLVIPTPPANGTNPVPTLSASLVCDGVLPGTTDAVPFDTRGNARIRATVEVSETCLAPAVLVHPNLATAVYIAANG